MVDASRPTTGTSSARGREALRAIAAFEALKGVIVIVAGFGLLGMLHRDLHVAAHELVDFFHLNPDGRASGFFLHAAERLGDMHLVAVAAGAMAYAIVRFVEAYGLWRGRRWAEWFAAGSGAIYIPFELQHMRPGHILIPAIALTINVAIVVFMLYTLRMRHAASAP